mmetsp:Transcript_20454/g.51942  ORF Transcript_20454/g.51942 Transcript_20454/m.51942 type:complete len:102 (-) Transcript_20454:951-1256(-)
MPSSSLSSSRGGSLALLVSSGRGGTVNVLVPKLPPFLKTREGARPPRGPSADFSNIELVFKKEPGDLSPAPSLRDSTRIPALPSARSTRAPISESGCAKQR